ncbi:MAG: hypothetical protein ABI207_07055 [Crocinitomicaceae bacterium]
MKNQRIKYLHSFTLIMLIFTLILAGCKKEPIAEFSLQKYEYVAGDQIVLQNLSSNLKTCKWEIINSNGDIIYTTEERNPSIILNILAENGNYIIRLTTYSKKEKKQAVSEKEFLIKSVKYYLTINSNGFGKQKDYKVYVDNQLVGTSFFNGVFQTKIPRGVRLVKLVSPSAIHEDVYDFKDFVDIIF